MLCPVRYGSKEQGTRKQGHKPAKAKTMTMNNHDHELTMVFHGHIIVFVGRSGGIIGAPCCQLTYKFFFAGPGLVVVVCRFWFVVAVLCAVCSPDASHIPATRLGCVARLGEAQW